MSEDEIAAVLEVSEFNTDAIREVIDRERWRYMAAHQGPNAGRSGRRPMPGQDERVLAYIRKDAITNLGAWVVMHDGPLPDRIETTLFADELMAEATCDRPDDMSEDVLVERLAEAIAKAGTDFNPWADPHAPGNAEWFAHYRDIARAVLPIVEDYCGEGHGCGFVAPHLDDAERKAERKAGAVDALREARNDVHEAAQAALRTGARRGVLMEAREIIVQHIARLEAS